jgi:hypothetical protein
MPKMVYKGQKPTILVSKKITPATVSTKPIVPVTVPVKYNAAKITAIITRIILSAELMFTFIKNDLVMQKSATA